MRSMRTSSASETSTSMSSERFRLAVFFVRMWRACEWPRLTLPDAVVRKRFAAPLCVLSFGIMTSLKQSALRLHHPAGAFRDGRTLLDAAVGLRLLRRLLLLRRL